MFKRVPLGLQILVWFFLNLALVCLVGGAVLFHSFGSGFEVLLDGKALERIDAFRVKVYRGINGQNSAMWGEALGSLSEAYHIEAAIFSPQGEWRAGRIRCPTVEVFGELERLPESWITPPKWNRGDSEKKAEADRKSRFFGGAAGAIFSREPIYLGAPKPFFLRSSGTYWIGVRLPPVRAGEDMENAVAYSLLIASDSVRVGGLVVEATPVILSLMVLGGSALFWIPLVRGITRPIFEMEKAALAMAGGNFSVRVRVDRSDELGRLANSINALAADFNERLESRRRFLGDIAHELATPLARMQWALDLLQSKAGERDDATVHDLREEVLHMVGLVEELLNFNKNLSPVTYPCESLRIEALIEKAAAQENIPSSALELSGARSPLVHANAQLLTRALANVLRNCRLYANNAGPVFIRAEAFDTKVILSITDRGPGVPAELIPRLGEPFFRIDAHRSRETGGTGLGLSIVKRCVEACGGIVQIENASPQGLTVSFILCRAEEVPSEPGPLAVASGEDIPIPGDVAVNG